MKLNKCRCGKRSKSKFFTVLSSAVYQCEIVQVFFCSSKCLYKAMGDYLEENLFKQNDPFGEEKR